MKNAVRYAALAMMMISSTALLSGLLRLLGTYSFAQHRFVPPVVGPIDTLFAAVACFGFGRSYQLLGHSKLDAASKTRTEIELAHVWFICAWFCFIFVVLKMNPPQRSVSLWVLAAFVLLTAVVIWSGFVVRKTLFKKSADALPRNVVESLRYWKGAHSIGFSNAMSIAIFGVALRFIGGSWYVSEFFFGLSLAFLLLWRPRQMAAVSAQPA